MKKYDSIRLFENPVFEAFSHVHPIVPLLVWLPFSAYLFLRGAMIPWMSMGTMAVWFLFGIFVWTLAEYLLHRFMFHFPAKSRAGKRFVYLFHGIHHDDPNDPTRLVMPPFFSVILAIILFQLFKWMMGPTLIYPFFSGFIVGYLIYDYTHYAVHHFKPKTRIGRFLTKYHMVHHYTEYHAKWGVSSPLWDFIFFSYKEKPAIKGRTASPAK